MCGIAGLLVAGEAVAYEQALWRMTRALAARGPDGEGYFLDGPIGLGHRRLAVIDVAGGRQPLHSEDGAITAIVNGEIYNFGALRRELERAGHRFATRSDSEVVVHGYETWGEGVLERLDGMFAFALWDREQRRLLLARDRMGEKPLFTAEAAGVFAFASELKALKHVPGLPGGLDHHALAHYLVYEAVPAPAALIEGVRKLEPGCWLDVRPGRAPSTHRYWDFHFPARHRRDPGLPDELLTELRRAVQTRLVSDVPLGVLLSGGVDSAAVAALAVETRPDLATFSIGFDDPGFDESPYARRVAAHLGTRHHEERLSAASVLDLLPQVGQLLDEPIGDSSIVPTHLLARFVRRHVTVALGGDGGDELFAGYPTFQAERAAALLDRLPVRLRTLGYAAADAVAARLPASLGYFSWDFKLRSFLRGAHMTGVRRHQLWLGAFTPAAALTLLGQETRTDLLATIDQRLDRCDARNPWDRLLYFYAKGYLADQVLTKVDRASMAVGLEVRAPLLAPNVVALASTVAPELRLAGRTTKWILKRAVRDLLPADILRRRKQGFAMPLGRWLQGPLRPLLEEELGPARLASTGLFDPFLVRRLIDEHIAGRADHRKPLWTLFAFQRWHAEWHRT